jgi:hypothetical protein
VGGASGGASVPGAEVQADEWRRASPRRNDRFMVKAGTPPGEIAFRGHARGREAGRRARGRQPGVGSLSTPGKRSSIRRGRGPTQERSASGAKGRSFRGSALLRRCRVGGRARGGNLRRLPGGRADRQTRPTLGRPDPRWQTRWQTRPRWADQTSPTLHRSPVRLDRRQTRPTLQLAHAQHDPRCNPHTHSTTRATGRHGHCRQAGGRRAQVPIREPYPRVRGHRGHLAAATPVLAAATPKQAAPPLRPTNPLKSLT